MIKTAFSKIGAAPEIWGLRLALIAAFCYMLAKSGAPTTGMETIVASLSLGMAALIFEYIASKRMAHGWFTRSPGAMLGWGLIWAGAFAYSANNWIGAAGENEAAKGNIQKAAFTSYADTRTDLETAQRRVNSEEKNLNELKAMTWQELPKVGGKPVMSVGAAEELLEAAKEGSTRWTQAKVALADLKERAKWQDRVDQAEKQLADARLKLVAAKSAAASVKTVSNDTREDLRWYVKYGHIDNETAQDIQSFLKVGVVSLFVSLFAILHVAEMYRGQQLPPWINWRGMITRARRLWDGTDHTVIVNKMHSAHVIRTPEGLKPMIVQHG